MDGPDNTAQKILWTTVLLLFCLNGLGCSVGLSDADLLTQLQEGTAPLIIDVRSQHEYDRNHVPGAVRIPFYAIGAGLKDRHVSREAPLVLYCEHGPRAGIAGIALFLEGYKNVYSLEGSMRGWRAREYPIEVVVHGSPTASGTVGHSR